MLDPLTLALCGITAIALVAAAAAFECGREYTRRQITALNREIADLRADLDDMRRTADIISADVRANAHECDLDRTRLRGLENPSPRHRFDDRPTTARQQLALPAARSVRDAVDPAWNGGTATYDSVTAMQAFERITDTGGLWQPPAERAAVTLYGTDDTAAIPRDTITGELEAVR
jgi:hypothetical protein